MAFKTEYTTISTGLALISGLMLAVGLWFVLAMWLKLDDRVAAAIASIIGGAEFFVIRYVLSQKYIQKDDAP